MTTKADALNAEHLPAYAAFLTQEEKFVRAFVTGRTKVADVGGGNGRAAPFIAPFVESYVIIDNDLELLAQASRALRQYGVISIATSGLHKARTFGKTTLVQGDAHKASAYNTGPFDASVSLFNTVGALTNPLSALRQMSEHSQAVFFTTMGRGEGVRGLRTEYYEKHGIPFTRNSRDTFFSDVWGPSRGYTLDEAVKLASNAGLQVSDAGILANLGNYVIGVSKKG